MAVVKMDSDMQTPMIVLYCDIRSSSGEPLLIQTISLAVLGDRADKGGSGSNESHECPTCEQCSVAERPPKSEGMTSAPFSSRVSPP